MITLCSFQQLLDITKEHIRRKKLSISRKIILDGLFEHPKVECFIELAFLTNQLPMPLHFLVVFKFVPTQHCLVEHPQSNHHHNQRRLTLTHYLDQLDETIQDHLAVRVQNHHF